MKPSVLLSVCAALASGCAAAQAPTSPGATAISPAETLLFETDHLARVETPAALIYEFRKVSNVEPGFSDKVRLDLAGAHGKTSATLHFLSGAHRQDIPALQDAHGNPVLLGFLERDIAEMKRLTGGSPAYFRKRIRMALADSAQVSTQSITYEGKSLPAQAVRIQPYLHDPMHARFEPYVHKTYTFIVSERVPGGVYQLRSSVANQGGAAVAGAAVSNAAVSNPAASRAVVAAQEAPIMASVRTAPPGRPAARTAAAGVAANDAALTGTAAKGIAAAGKTGAATRADAPTPGGTAATVPAIEETLTLVSVTHPKRREKQ